MWENNSENMASFAWKKSGSNKGGHDYYRCKTPECSASFKKALKAPFKTSHIDEHNHPPMRISASFRSEVRKQVSTQLEVGATPAVVFTNLVL